jgi:hypothetical protein
MGYVWQASLKEVIIRLIEKLRRLPEVAVGEDGHPKVLFPFKYA